MSSASWSEIFVLQEARRVTLDPVSRDDDLVRRAQAGDASAFRALFVEHRAEVARLVQRMVGPRADLEDLVQEVFLQVHRSLDGFRGQSKFTTWLHRVTVNVVLMQRRSARSRPVLVEDTATEGRPDGGAWPDEEAARRERVRAFYRLLDRLADKKRTVYVLHEIDGRSPADIAKIVGAPVLTVRTRLFYARRELAEMLRDEPTLAALGHELEAEASERRSSGGTP